MLGGDPLPSRSEADYRVLCAGQQLEIGLATSHESASRLETLSLDGRNLLSTRAGRELSSYVSDLGRIQVEQISCPGSLIRILVKGWTKDSELATYAVALPARGTARGAGTTTPDGVRLPERIEAHHRLSCPASPIAIGLASRDRAPSRLETLTVDGRDMLHTKEGRDLSSFVSGVQRAEVERVTCPGSKIEVAITGIDAAGETAVDRVFLPSSNPPK